jgi:hypothetical protein
MGVFGWAFLSSWPMGYCYRVNARPRERLIMSEAPLTPDDRQRWIAENIREAKRAHYQVAEFGRNANESALNAVAAVLRTAVGINGGAAISVVILIGGLTAQNRVQLNHLKDLANSLLFFVFGVVAAVLAMALTYGAYVVSAKFASSLEKSWQAPYYRAGPNTAPLGRLKVLLLVFILLVGLASLALFVWGMIDIRNAISAFK